MDVVVFGESSLVGEKKAAFFLSKKLGYNYIDCTTKNSGPQAVFRIATKYITTTESPFLAVIGWSNPYSIELRKIYKRNPVVDFHDSNYFTYSARLKNLDLDFRRLKRFENILTDIDLGNNRWCAFAYSMQETFKHLNIPYVMYNVDQSIIWNSHTMHMIKNIDRSKYVGIENPKSNAKKYCKKLGHNFDTDEGQRLLAQLLSSKLEKA